MYQIVDSGLSLILVDGTLGQRGAGFENQPTNLPDPNFPPSDTIDAGGPSQNAALLAVY